MFDQLNLRNTYKGDRSSCSTNSVQKLSLIIPIMSYDKLPICELFV